MPDEIFKVEPQLSRRHIPLFLNDVVYLFLKEFIRTDEFCRVFLQISKLPLLLFYGKSSCFYTFKFFFRCQLTGKELLAQSRNSLSEDYFQVPNRPSGCINPSFR